MHTDAKRPPSTRTEIRTLESGHGSSGESPNPLRRSLRNPNLLLSPKKFQGIRRGGERSQSHPHVKRRLGDQVVRDTSCAFLKVAQKEKITASRPEIT
uniref:Uncharacterized protein n=1 Tax=Steinernema glaseri TaxID=37863 RepID=A0A1I7YHU5_9BILA